MAGVVMKRDEGLGNIINVLYAIVLHFFDCKFEFLFVLDRTQVVRNKRSLACLLDLIDWTPQIHELLSLIKIHAALIATRVTHSLFLCLLQFGFLDDDCHQMAVHLRVYVVKVYFHVVLLLFIKHTNDTGGNLSDFVVDSDEVGVSAVGSLAVIDFHLFDVTEHCRDQNIVALVNFAEV